MTKRKIMMRRREEKEGEKEKIVERKEGRVTKKIRKK